MTPRAGAANSLPQQQPLILSRHKYLQLEQAVRLRLRRWDSKAGHMRWLTFHSGVCGGPDQAIGSLLSVLAVHLCREVDADCAQLAMVQLPAVQLCLDQPRLRDEAVNPCPLQAMRQGSGNISRPLAAIQLFCTRTD